LERVVEVFGGETGGLGERGNGTARIVLGEEDGAEMKVCGGEGWVEGNGLLEVCCCFEVFLLLCEECAEGIVQSGVVWSGCESKFNAGLCGGGLCACFECGGVGDGLVGGERDVRFIRGSEEWDGAGVVAQLCVGEGEVKRGVGVGGVELVREFEFGGCGFGVVLGEENCAEGGVASGDVGSEVDDAGELSVRGDEVVALVGFSAGAEGGVGSFDGRGA
jgi:hypothetical protein